jgi:hypothetical protein
MFSVLVVNAISLVPKVLGNAGFSKLKSSHIQGIKPQDQSFMSMDGLYAENAGAIFCLVQGFITMKMAAFRHALREPSQEAIAALQLL